MSATTRSRRRGGRTVRTVALPLAALSALLIGGAPAAPADPGERPPPRPQPLRQADRLADPQLFGTVGPSGIADGDGIGLAKTTRPVAPGTELTTFDRLESDKWLRASALSVDLDEGARVDYLSSGTVSERATVSELTRAHDPGTGRRTVAAINADFFDIQQTGAPLGPGLSDGKITHSPAAGASQGVGIGPGSAGRILDLYFEGTLTLPDRSSPLEAYNAANVPSDGIGVYTAQWGRAARAQTVDGATQVTEVTVENGTVTSVADTPGSGPVPAGSTVLLGRDLGAKTLATLTPGDAVSWEYAPRAADGGALPRTAVGGRGLLVVDGEPQNWEGKPNNTTAPRTAVGFSADGDTMHVLSVDGRQAHSGGVTLTELALMMDRLGAHSALNLDGGGSSALLARKPGGTAPQLVNSPSDGAERPVPNGLAVTAPRGSGELAGFRVEPAADPDAARAPETIPGGDPWARQPAGGWDRVFPGLTRALTATGHDETYGPAAGEASWLSADPDVGGVRDDGTFLAHRSGSTEVTARAGRAEGGLELTVVGALDRIVPTDRRVGLADGEEKGRFGIVGFDANGTRAPIDPTDVHLEYDHALFDITPDVAAGGFTVLARTATAAGTVTATVDGKRTVLAVTVGLRDALQADFEDADQWRFSAARATGSIAADAAGQRGSGLRLTYDFSQSTATRAAYVTPPRQIEVPGQPQSFRLWVKGDGRGAWPSLHLKDAQGTDHILRGPHVEWQGWRQITFTVPPGLSAPIRVHRFYIAETRPTAQYSSEIVIDELTAQIPPETDLPPSEVVRDPLIATATDTARRDWRFAVVSDAQFVARAPDSDIVRKARRTLREVRAAAPDFVVVNGDWVDEGSPEDLAFARRMLTEELGDALPWFYVPGNHEVMGGSIDHFTREFGKAQLTFDHLGTRVITLDTSSLTLRGGGYAQIVRLRQQLDAASEDASISSVLVIAHVPPRDPTTQPSSQLSDRLEAALLERWLAEFRRTTGKGVAFIGSHVGVFDASRVNGVPYLINGDAGKTPAAAPGEGGFTGWSMVGVDRVSSSEQLRTRQQPHRRLPDWISVQTRAHVDALLLDAPEALPAGHTARVKATVAQGTGDRVREVPVGFPLSADWSGSAALHIGDPDRADAQDVAAYDPHTGVLTAFRTGTVTLTVTVSGEQRHAEIQVTAR